LAYETNQKNEGGRLRAYWGESKQKSLGIKRGGTGCVETGCVEKKDSEIGQNRPGTTAKHMPVREKKQTERVPLTNGLPDPAGAAKSSIWFKWEETRAMAMMITKGGKLKKEPPLPLDQMALRWRSVTQRRNLPRRPTTNRNWS